jgi:hypothetical protein
MAVIAGVALFIAAHFRLAGNPSLSVVLGAFFVIGGALDLYYLATHASTSAD